MKLSIESYGLVERFGEYKAVDLAKEAGFDAIDYSFYWGNEKEEVLGASYIEHAVELRRYLDKAGIECNQAHAPFTIRYGCKFDVTDQKYLWLIHAIEAAALLGAKNIIVHAITVPAGVDFEEYNVRYYKSLIPYCEKFGVRVAVENLFAKDPETKRIIGKIGSPEELNRIVAKIDSPWIVACVDVGHAMLTGYPPEEFIRGVSAPILKALHIHDNDCISDRHIAPYTGEFNWIEIMKALQKAKYEGELTFELVGFLKKFPDELIPDALRFIQSIGKHLVSIYNSASEEVFI